MYRTYLQSSIRWGQYTLTRKKFRESALSYDLATEMCAQYNKTRTPWQIKRGTMLEFAVEQTVRGS